jgi:hypothetical protein
MGLQEDLAPRSFFCLQYLRYPLQLVGSLKNNTIYSGA